MPLASSLLGETGLRASKRRLRLGHVLSIIGIWAFVLGFLWYVGVFGGNVHEVVKDRVYRSAQLTGHNLDDVFTEDHIRTDINLRGVSQNRAWYRDEVAECGSHDVVHVDIKLSAMHLPPPAELDKLLTVFDHGQYPILFHCEAGADRTGLVAALYVCAYQHVPVQQAVSDELSWRYGHFGFGLTHAMDDFFKLYDKTSDGLDLRTWILTKYPAIYAASRK